MRKKIIVTAAFFFIVLLPIQSAVNAAQNAPIQIECTKSPLTGLKFAENIHAIAVHGDLTDVAFIKKILPAKFTSEYSIEGGGIVNKKRIIYNANSLLGLPMYISLDIKIDSNIQKKYKIISTMRFENWATPRCGDHLHLSFSELSSLFQNGFVNGKVYDNPRVGSKFKQLAPSAVDGSKILIAVSYSNNDEIINSVTLRQVP